MWSRPMRQASLGGYGGLGLRLMAADGVQALGDELLDQLGARGLVLDQYHARRKRRALLAHRALQFGVFHAPAQHV